MKRFLIKSSSKGVKYPPFYDSFVGNLRNMRFPIILFLFLPFLATSQTEPDCTKETYKFDNLSISFMGQDSKDKLNFGFFIDGNFCVKIDFIGVFYFEDDTTIYLQNYSRDNCTGTVAYSLTKENLNTILEKDLREIAIVGVGEVFYKKMPIDKESYLEQLIKCVLSTQTK